MNTDSRRCVTAKQCSNSGRVIYDKECLQHCPQGFEIVKDTTEVNTIDNAVATQNETSTLVNPLIGTNFSTPAISVRNDSNICKPCLKNCKKVCSSIPEISKVLKLKSIYKF